MDQRTSLGMGIDYPLRRTLTCDANGGSWPTGGGRIQSAVAIPLQQLTSGNCQQQVSVQGLVDAENAVKSDHLHKAAALKAIQPVPRAGPHIARALIESERKNRAVGKAIVGVVGLPFVIFINGKAIFCAGPDAISIHEDGKDVIVGVNSVILKGIHIGDGAVVAAGSVVTKSIPANEIWGGNPARKISDRR